IRYRDRRSGGRTDADWRRAIDGRDQGFTQRKIGHAEAGRKSFLIHLASVGQEAAAEAGMRPTGGHLPKGLAAARNQGEPVAAAQAVAPGDVERLAVPIKLAMEAGMSAARHTLPGLERYRLAIDRDLR